ncbi:MAG: hypothetical protein LQ350_005382 [Teloschistes chrysophthalmus]|nr:MAG: hypothetical protein LQ350_005382 [Niorma chrysophthalma]
MNAPKVTCKFDFDEEILERLHQPDVSITEYRHFVHPEIEMCMEIIKTFASFTDARCAGFAYTRKAGRGVRCGD